LIASRPYLIVSRRCIAIFDRNLDSIAGLRPSTSDRGDFTPLESIIQGKTVGVRRAIRLYLRLTRDYFYLLSMNVQRVSLHRTTKGSARARARARANYRHNPVAGLQPAGCPYDQIYRIPRKYFSFQLARNYAAGARHGTLKLTISKFNSGRKETAGSESKLGAYLPSSLVFISFLCVSPPSPHFLLSVNLVRYNCA